MHSSIHPEREVRTVGSEVVCEMILRTVMRTMKTRYVMSTGKKTILDESPLSQV
jgi:hypothetical protein